SFIAPDGAVLCGSVRYWPITIGEAPALLLGPLAVHPERQNQGIGKALMELSLKRAAELGHGLVILVGDPPYYARVGFAPVPMGQMTLPGPVDYRRMVFRGPAPRAPRGGNGEGQAAGGAPASPASP